MYATSEVEVRWHGYVFIIITEKSTHSDTDIDDKSLQFAKQNVKDNNLQNRIKLLQTQPDDPLLPLDKMGFEK